MKTSRGHITYCTNIHPGENWPDHFAQLKQHFPPIKQAVSPNAPMGIGLRLSNIASLQLDDAEALQLFNTWLLQNDAYVFTMNGFPYGGFHHTVVKDQVHAPDWLTTERVQYTKRLFNILAELLPIGMDGGISTSPLSYRLWFNGQLALAHATTIATHHILEIVEHLAELENSTGKIMHLDIEPEPDGILESGVEFIEWYTKVLLPIGLQYLKLNMGVDVIEAERLIKTHVRLCYDICHFAVGYENHGEVMQHLQNNGILVGKLQVSAALKANLHGYVAERSAIKTAFEPFNESTYLHQVVAKTTSEGFKRYADLPNALADVNNPQVTEWRAHFHVPIFERDFGVLQSTQSDITEVMQLHTTRQQTNHIEIETYTWEVLPLQIQLPLQQSIVREIQWLFNTLDVTL